MYLQRKFPVQICKNDKIILYCCQLGYEVSNQQTQINIFNLYIAKVKNQFQAFKNDLPLKRSE